MVARLPNYFHGDIQTLNYKTYEQDKIFSHFGQVICPKFVLISHILEKFCNVL